MQYLYDHHLSNSRHAALSIDVSIKHTQGMETLQVYGELIKDLENRHWIAVCCLR
jgi:hypothetical protein